MWDYKTGNIIIHIENIPTIRFSSLVQIACAMTMLTMLNKKQLCPTNYNFQSLFVSSGTALVQIACAMTMLTMLNKKQLCPTNYNFQSLFVSSGTASNKSVVSP